LTSDVVGLAEHAPRSTGRQRVGRFEFAPHNCFACGQLNVSGMQLRLHADDGRCWTELALPRRFEGWEGVVHGGVVSAILDEVMAWSLIGQDRLGLTARLEVEFHRPVPVETPIRADGWITEHRRRRFDTAARLIDVATGRVLADATAIYVAAPLAQEAALRERYDIRVVGDEA
jgi:acyl-coenzyme A thioesterase PaaI-like protein